MAKKGWLQVASKRQDSENRAAIASMPHGSLIITDEAISLKAKSSWGDGGYRREIDGLRAVAVLAVIAHHFNRALLPSGYLGVDIFFVISGYVITSSLVDRHHRSLGDLLLEFYARRIKRLLPALSVCVLLTSLLVCFFDPDPWLSLRTGFTAIFGASNLYLLRRATDYFAQSSDLNSFLQTWSLGVEEQFYLFFPVLLWFAALRPRARNDGWIIAGALMLLSAASLALYVWLSGRNPPAAYFLMPTRLWELGAGSLLFLLERRSIVASLLKKIPPAVVFVLVLGTLFMPTKHAVESTFLVVVFTTLLIGSARQGTVAAAAMSWRPVVYLGLISYSLYLWHWSVLSIARWTIGVHLWSTPILLGVMFLAAVGSYHLIESPLRRTSWSGTRLRTIAYGACGAALAAGFVAILAKPLDGHLYLGDRALALEKPASAIIQSSWIGERSDRSRQLEDDIRTCNMTPQFLTGTSYAPKPNVDSEFIRRCMGFVTPSAVPRLVLIGDSFAHTIARHLALAASSIGYQFGFIFGYGCPYPLPFGYLKAHTTDMCFNVDETLLRAEIINGLRPGDIVVVRLHYAKSQYLRYPADALPPVDAYDAAVLALYESVRDKGAQLLLVGSNPVLTEEEFKSLTPQWFEVAVAVDRKYPIDPESRFYLKIDEHFSKLSRNIVGFKYFSTLKYLCDSSISCVMRYEGKPIYYDREHISEYEVDMFYPDLLSKLKSIVAAAN